MMADGVGNGPAIAGEQKAAGTGRLDIDAAASKEVNVPEGLRAPNGRAPAPPPPPAIATVLPPASVPEFVSAPVPGVVSAYIEPERTVTATISARDVNRIHCGVPVDDVFYSKEKPVSISPVGSDVFVKVQKKVTGLREEFVTMPIDLHIVCGGEVYTMILMPQEIDAVTLRLGNPVKSKAAAIAKEWGSLPIEEKVQKLTRMVYRDELPPTFQRSELVDERRYIRFWRNLRLRAVQRVTAQGLGLAAIEYEVVALEPVTLDERDFLNTEISKSIVSVTVDPLALPEPGRKARLIIIERSMTDGR